jgi:hypothetical protein
MTLRVSLNGTDVTRGKKLGQRDTFLGVNSQTNTIHMQNLLFFIIVTECGNIVKWELPQLLKKLDRGSHLQMSLIPQVAGRRSKGIADSSNPIVTSLEAAAEEGPFWIEW